MEKANGQQYPFFAWTLTPNFVLQERFFVLPGSKYGTHLTDNGTEIPAAWMHHTREDALADAEARIKRTETDIRKLEYRLAIRKTNVAKARGVPAP